MGGRSAARRARATEQHWRTTTRRAATGLVVAAALLATTAVAAVVASGVGLGPRTAEEVARATATARPTADVAERPAQLVVDDLMRAAPPGWTPRGPVARGVAEPLTEGCDVPLPVGVTDATRRFSAAGREVSVTVTAYSAGLGPVAVRDRIAGLGSCRGITAGTSSTLAGVDAYVAWRSSSTMPPLAVLGWRRGDVVMVVRTPGRDPGSLARFAQVLDARLLAALQGRCAEIGSTLADASRSPYIEGVDFTGRLVPVEVGVDPLPTPEGQSPLPTLSPAPSISFPARPADPIWPTELPSPVGSPVLPSSPAPEPTTTEIASRAPDPTGPGCGWAFTGVTAPQFSSEDEAARVEALAAQARDQLLADQEQWRLSVETYRGAAVEYDAQLVAFLQYAEQVRVVAEAWDAITAARDTYAAELAAYEAAVLAAEQFAADQAAAQEAYDAAVQACGASDPGVDPTPGLTPNLLPTPTPSLTDSPTPTVTPTDTPTTTPTPTVTTTPTVTPTVVGCPPEVPPILFEQPPVVPPSPTPPPDPTPTG